MNKKLELFFMMQDVFRNSYLEHNMLYGKYAFDNNVNDCLMKMYFTILTNENDANYEERYQRFLESYKNLDEEQKEYVREDFVSIVDAQEKNKEKIKRKGMINYE